MATDHAVKLELGDLVRLRKPHPCGSQDWEVVRLGADIGLVCQGCRRRVVLPRRTLARRLVAVPHSGTPAVADGTSASSPPTQVSSETRY